MINRKNSILITCVSGCEGKKNLCIPIIIDHLNNGNTVAMQYTVHIQDVLSKYIKYTIETKYINNIPVFMYLAKTNY